MKKTAALFLTILLLGAVVLAQPPGPKMPTIEDRIKDLTERLDLTDNQVEQLKVIYEESNVSELEEKMQSTKGDREQMMKIGEEMRSEMEKINKSIKEILTDDQKEEFQKYLDEMEKNRPGKPGARR